MTARPMPLKAHTAIACCTLVVRAKRKVKKAQVVAAAAMSFARLK
jgi:hypothetical protein